MGVALAEEGTTMRRATGRFGIGVVGAAAVVPLALLGCSSSTPTASTDSTTTTAAGAAPKNTGGSITIRTKAFEPSDVTVKANQTVTWTNASESKHTVTAKEGQVVNFRSETLQRDTTFVQTFSQPGTYSYFCSVHGVDVMSGTVTVTP